jgi:hypothetical protein
MIVGLSCLGVVIVLGFALELCPKFDIYKIFNYDYRHPDDIAKDKE